MDISKKIKAIREERKISQSEIARRLGVEPTNYPRMEKRGDKLTVEQLGKIAGALGVTVGELLTDEPQTVQDNERVKELEKRVSELEDRVKDKEQIIRGMKNDISEWFFDFVIEVAEKYGIGKIVFFDTVTNETLDSYDSDDDAAFNSPIWNKKRFEVPPTIDYRYEFTDAEKKEIATIMINHPDYSHIIGFFVYDLVGDEIMQKAYDNRHKFHSNL